MELIDTARTYWKEINELNYWRRRKEVEGNLSNDHYEHFYTKHFGLDRSYYSDKVILDIGCGPRGSLEWAAMAKRRIGLDPLVKGYSKLGIKHHDMEYLEASSENIPLRDRECGIASSFNSLDHVYDVAQSLKEIKRITAPMGFFLLLVEVNHMPTACEPHNLTPKMIIQLLEPEFTCQSLCVYKPSRQGIYQSIRENIKLPAPYETNERGYMSASFLRNMI